MLSSSPQSPQSKSNSLFLQFPSARGSPPCQSRILTVSLLLLLQLLLLLLLSDPALPAANLAAVHCAVERDVEGLLDSQDSHKGFTQWNGENTYILRARGNLGLQQKHFICSRSHSCCMEVVSPGNLTYWISHVVANALVWLIRWTIHIIWYGSYGVAVLGN